MQWVTTKENISAWEHIKLVESREDKKWNELKKIRQSFILNKQFMVIDTVFIKEGPISILRIESEKGKKDIEFPDWIQIVRDVTDEEEYDTWSLAKKDYVLNAKDADVLFPKPKEEKEQEEILIEKLIQIAMEKKKLKQSGNFN